jgi:hypothetical protein
MKNTVIRLVFVVACTVSLVVTSDIEKLIRENNEKRILQGKRILFKFTISFRKWIRNWIRIGIRWPWRNCFRNWNRNRECKFRSRWSKSNGLGIGYGIASGPGA